MMQGVGDVRAIWENKHEIVVERIENINTSHALVRDVESGNIIKEYNKQLHIKFKKQEDMKAYIHTHIFTTMHKNKLVNIYHSVFSNISYAFPKYLMRIEAADYRLRSLYDFLSSFNPCRLKIQSKADKFSVQIYFLYAIDENAFFSACRERQYQIRKYEHNCQIILKKYFMNPMKIIQEQQCEQKRKQSINQQELQQKAGIKQQQLQIIDCVKTLVSFIDQEIVKNYNIKVISVKPMEVSFFMSTYEKTLSVFQTLRQKQLNSIQQHINIYFQENEFDTFYVLMLKYFVNPNKQIMKRFQNQILTICRRIEPNVVYVTLKLKENTQQYTARVHCKSQEAGKQLLINIRALRAEFCKEGVFSTMFNANLLIDKWYSAEAMQRFVAIGKGSKQIMNNLKEANDKQSALQYEIREQARRQKANNYNLRMNKQNYNQIFPRQHTNFSGPQRPKYQPKVYKRATNWKEKNQQTSQQNKNQIIAQVNQIQKNIKYDETKDKKQQENNQNYIKKKKKKVKHYQEQTQSKNFAIKPDLNNKFVFKQQQFPSLSSL